MSRTGPRPHYSSQAIRAYYVKLDAYRKALESGDSHEIVIQSIRIHAAKGTVPQRLRSLPGRIFREIARKPQQS